MNTRKRSRGFSLIELLIVVTIILIIAAIAIPRLLQVKQLANATAAVSNMRSINTAETAYASEFPSLGYSVSLTDLGGTVGQTTAAPTSTQANLVDESLANSGTTAKQGYIFAYDTSMNTAAPFTVYTMTGTPQGNTATRDFFTDQTSEIRYADGAAATATSSLIG